MPKHRPTFNKGDKLICIDDEHMTKFLTKGVEYVVLDTHPNSTLMDIRRADEVNAEVMGAYAKRFELVPTPQFEVGKKYKTVNGTIHYECITIHEDHAVMGYYTEEKKFFSKVVRNPRIWEEVVETVVRYGVIQYGSSSSYWASNCKNYHNVKATLNYDTGELLTIEKL